jgi:hypothetical protein
MDWPRCLWMLWVVVSVAGAGGELARLLTD